VQKSELFRLERKRFLKHLQTSPELCFRVFSLLCSHLRETTENLEDTALHKLPNRLAKRLTLLAADSEAGDGTVLHIVQSDLASMLGVHRQAVNRHLREFEKDGLIVLKRQLIEIVDQQALADLASPGQIDHQGAWGNENLAALRRSVFTFSHLHEDTPTPQERHSAGLIAIDAAEYSRSLMTDAAGTLKRIEAGLTAVDQAIEQYQGHTVWHTGDRVLAEFPDAQLAMQAALTIQEQVNPAKSVGKGKRVSLFRIGVHHGEVLADDNRFSGEAVNTAIRLTQLAGAGGIAISGAVRDALDNREQLELQFLGDHELKNVSATVPVYSVRAIPLFKILALRAETLVPRRFRPSAVVAALIALLAGFWFTGDWMARRSAPPAGSPVSIAVLPFANGGDATLDYLALGIPEEVRTSLSRIPVMRVIGRESSSYFSDHTTSAEEIARIGEELNVTYIVEGSVRKTGDQLSISARLIKAEDGFHLWSETFNRSMDDVFEIQKEIAAAVTDEFKVNLLGAVPNKKASDPEVYALYLRGRYFQNLGDRRNRTKAFSAYQQALAIDPGYAPAWMGVAMHYQFLILRTALPQEEGYLLSLQATEKALAADKNLALAWCSLGYIRMVYDWDWEGASAAIDKGLELDPNYANCVGVAASLAWSHGQSAKHVRLREKAVDLDPLSLVGLSGLGLAYVDNNRPDDALKIFERILAIHPDYPWIHEKIGRAYLKQGNADKALIEFNKYPDWRQNTLNKLSALVALGRDSEAQAKANAFLAEANEVDPFWTAAIYVWLDDNDKAFEWLEIAFQQRNTRLRTILTNPYLSNLRTDPRYPVFLERMGLLEAWKVMPL
jgi:TolB-like protein/class 3 adenylate cyclase/Tfp pilus assembly protein PilF